MKGNKSNVVNPRLRSDLTSSDGSDLAHSTKANYRGSVLRRGVRKENTESTHTTHRGVAPLGLALRHQAAIPLNDATYANDDNEVQSGPNTRLPILGLTNPSHWIYWIQ